MTPIYVHRYRLVTKSPANSITKRTEYEGALVRLGPGFACIHPWSELGDLSLDEQLDLLADGRADTDLLKCALICATMDGVAREQNSSLFHDIDVPESHWLWNPDEDEVRQVESVKELGIGAVKVKCNGERGGIRVLEQIARLAQESVAIRIDLNGVLDSETFGPWWEQVPKSVKKRVEFIEDPMRYDGLEWSDAASRYNIDFALDRAGSSEPVNGGFHWRVIKPAVDLEETWQASSDTTGFVFTSYMDHPFGQVFAAYQAAKAERECHGEFGLAGLISHTRFETNAFSEALGIEEGGRLMVPGGPGLGFGDLLETLDWKKL